MLRLFSFRQLLQTYPSIHYIGLYACALFLRLLLESTHLLNTHHLCLTRRSAVFLLKCSGFFPNYTNSCKEMCPHKNRNSIHMHSITPVSFCEFKTIPKIIWKNLTLYIKASAHVEGIKLGAFLLNSRVQRHSSHSQSHIGIPK